MRIDLVTDNPRVAIPFTRAIHHRHCSHEAKRIKLGVGGPSKACIRAHALFWLTVGAVALSALVALMVE